MQDGYQTKVMLPEKSAAVMCRECGGTREVEVRVKTEKGIEIEKRPCPTCSSYRGGYAVK